MKYKALAQIILLGSALAFLPWNAYCEQTSQGPTKETSLLNKINKVAEKKSLIQATSLANRHSMSSRRVKPHAKGIAGFSTKKSPVDINRQIKSDILHSKAPTKESRRENALATNSVQQKNTQSFLSATNGAGNDKVRFNKRNGTVAYIKGDAVTPVLSKNVSDMSRSRTVATEFLTNNRDLLKLNDPMHELKLKAEKLDRLGSKHFRYQQTHNGIPVWGKEIVVHLSPDDNVYLMQGNYIQSPSRTLTSPGISASDAFEFAMSHLNASNVLDKKQEVGLIYYPDGNVLQLAYKVLITPSFDQKWLYFINAHDGTFIHRISVSYQAVVSASGTDENAQARTFNAWDEAGTYYLVDPSVPTIDASYDPIGSGPNSSGDTFIMDCNSTTCASASYFITSNALNSGWDTSGVGVAYNVKQTYDYYINTHGRDGMDGNGSNIIAFVNYDTNANNAFYVSGQLVFGDGDGSFMTGLASSLDVVAHEFTHGVIEASAALVYENQSGALNESFADVFAALLDTGDWLIGEDVVLTGTGYLRSMSNPSNGSQPGHMDDYVNLPNTDAGDHGGVHINSGIPNRAAYLIAEGLTSEGLGTSIGRAKLESIYYRALTTYLLSYSQFLDARLATIQSAEDLYGAGSTEVQAVIDAWDEVGVAGGSLGSPDTQAPSSTSALSGKDYMVYLYPTDGSHDNPYLATETYDLYMQEIPSPFVSYDPALDGGPYNVTVYAAYTKPAMYTNVNGSYLYFIGTDYNLYEINAGGETQITSDGDMYSMAVSPLGNYFAYTTTTAGDNNIYVVDLIGNSDLTIPLVHTTTRDDGGTQDVVLYADSLAFDYTGRKIIFDALNCAELPGSTCGSGGGMRYWSIGEIDIDTETVTFLIPNQPTDYDVGYPTFAYNNNYVIAFDFIDWSNFALSGTVSSAVLDYDFKTDTLNAIIDPNGTSNSGTDYWGASSFYGDDNYIVTQTFDDAGGYAVRIPLDSTWAGNLASAILPNIYDVAMPSMHRAGIRNLDGTLTISATNLDFGMVTSGSSAQKTLTLTNNGDREINITNISISGSGDFTHNATNARLTQGNSMTVTVTFSPSTAGSLAETLSISSNADSPNVNIALIGSGVVSDTTGPSMPSGLTATASSFTQIDLSWTASTDDIGVTGYRIYRDSSATVLKSVTGTSTSDTGLSASTSYCYEVSAYDAAGNESAKSTQVCVTTLSGGGGGAGSGGGGGCFIATAAYGSYMAPDVMVLREFRDKHLLNNSVGRVFVNMYYTYSPPVADYIAEHEGLRTSTRLVLTPIVYVIKYPGIGIIVFGFILITPLVIRRKRKGR